MPTPGPSGGAWIRSSGRTGRASRRIGASPCGRAPTAPRRRSSPGRATGDWWRSTRRPGACGPPSVTEACSTCGRGVDAREDEEYGMTSPPAIYRDLVIVGVAGARRRRAWPGRRRARVRCAIGTAAVALPHRAPAGRARPRDLGRRCVAATDGRQRLDVDERRRGAGPGVPAAGVGVVRLLRRRPTGCEPLREFAGRPRRRHRRSPLASAAGPSRHLGLRPAGPADPGRRRARAAERFPPSCSSRRWGSSSSSTASPASRCSASRSARCRKATCRARRRGRRSRFPSSRRRCRGSPPSRATS